MSENTAHSDLPAARPLGEDSSGYDPITETYHSRFDGGPSTVVVAIVEAVAAVTNREPDALSPLYDTVDPEALADLVTSARGHPIDVSISYEGCQVTVSSDGGVVVEPPEN
ncbi:HalOD1 output domain-containing protein [Natrinema sp. LN54]|uniref:HalOD1 output domain-containing protein n=1 Tax=Natrinema sp. LN54 TaxID=3458705 RepID=UPI00403569D3